MSKRRWGLALVHTREGLQAERVGWAKGTYEVKVSRSLSKDTSFLYSSSILSLNRSSSYQVSQVFPHHVELKETYLERCTLTILCSVQDHTGILDVLHICPPLERFPAIARIHLLPTESAIRHRLLKPRIDETHFFMPVNSTSSAALFASRGHKGGRTRIHLEPFGKYLA
jgi:hypothetical protein